MRDGWRWIVSRPKQPLTSTRNARKAIIDEVGVSGLSEVFSSRSRVGVAISISDTAARCAGVSTCVWPTAHAPTLTFIHGSWQARFQHHDLNRSHPPGCSDEPERGALIAGLVGCAPAASRGRSGRFGVTAMGGCAPRSGLRLRATLLGGGVA